MKKFMSALKDNPLTLRKEMVAEIEKLRVENELARERYESRYSEVLALRDQLAEAREIIEQLIGCWPDKFKACAFLERNDGPKDLEKTK